MHDSEPSGPTCSGRRLFLDEALDRTSIAPQGEDISADELMRWYRAMRLARTFETRLARIYRQGGKVEGAVYLGMGHEATSVGVASLLRDGDYWSTVARNLSAWFLRGVEPKAVMARWFGRDEAPQRGRDLGLFLADLQGVGLAPYNNGSMASWLPSGAGFAWSLKRKGAGNVYVAMTGDGATSPGDFYEGLSIAAIHRLPLVVIVENNCYAYSTPQDKQMPVANVADRAAAFNIPSSIGFGSDVFEVRRLAAEAIDRAREGGGPTLVELKCFRQRGHGEHDDMKYVDPDLRRFWEARDPIALFTDYLITSGSLAPSEIERVDAECSAIVEAAVDYADSVPFPEASSVAEGVFR
jgi:TPP-dependent pyruvate/acetoin dehydrogenase alpha subunit